jgi:flagellar hook assembly protein FlgD
MTLVAIRIYNVLGQQVTVIADGNYPAGNHRIRWNAGGLPSGVYFCRMQANGNIRTIKMLLTK